MDPYDVLKVSRRCSDAELRQAYRRRVLETHPDRGGTDAAFRRVQEAFEAAVREREGVAEEAPLPAWAEQLHQRYEEERDRVRAALAKEHETIVGGLKRSAAAAQELNFGTALGEGGAVLDRLKEYWQGGAGLLRKLGVKRSTRPRRAPPE